MVNTGKVTSILTRMVIVFFLVFFFSPLLVRPSFAEDPVVGPNNSDCTKGIVVKTTSAEFSVSPVGKNGAFGYGYMTITGCTQNSAGLTITMKSSTTDAKLTYSKSGINQFISPLTNAVEVSSGANEFPVNTWGWGLSNVVDPENGIDGRTGYGIYSPVPNSTQSAVVVGSTASAGTKSTVIYFGAKANTDILYGHYVNTVVVTAVDNTVPTPPASTTFNEAFAAYGAAKVTASNGQQYYKMQDMNIDICNAVAGPTDATMEVSTELIDSRDGKIYRIAKVLGGECWMTQNLALGNSNATTTLTSMNSDVASNYILPKAQTSEDEETTSWDTPNDLPGELGIDYQSFDSNHVYATGNADYGNYYTWYTATAGSGGSLTADGDIASESICSKGWTLPTKDQYTALNTAYSGDSTIPGSIRSGAAPLYYTTPGIYKDGGIDTTNNRGDYWASQSKSDARSYELFFDSNGIAVGNNTRNYGVSLRCVARSDIHGSPLPEDTPGMTESDDQGHGGTIASKTFASAPGSGSNPGMSGTLDDENAPAQGVSDETELSAEILAAVKHMEALIESLPSASAVTLEYSELIESAMSAWNALSDLERSLVDSYLGMKYEAVVAAYQNLLANQPINGVLVALGLAGAAVATGAIVVVAAKKNRNERYYGDE